MQLAMKVSLCRMISTLLFDLHSWTNSDGVWKWDNRLNVIVGKVGSWDGEKYEFGWIHSFNYAPWNV